MVRKIATAIALVTVVAGVSACNTVKGLGEDISSVGRAGEDAID
ncbi:entericidin A/B family lipoprotein [Croceicoccus naphthovorans]|nr:entericidin A/B family lipoprotein [Croceicoccus naphthovorans]MBB3989699.1 putative small secreted protein [Croceicoccus naphthovorans]